MIPLDDPRNQTWFGDGADGTVDMSVDPTPAETSRDRKTTSVHLPAARHTAVAERRREWGDGA